MCNKCFAGMWVCDEQKVFDDFINGFSKPKKKTVVYNRPAPAPQPAPVASKPEVAAATEDTLSPKPE